MTIEEIRAAAATITLEQLEVEHHMRDKLIQALRAEKREIRKIYMEDLIVKKNREDRLAMEGKRDIVLSPGVIGLSIGGQNG